MRTERMFPKITK